MSLPDNWCALHCRVEEPGEFICPECWHEWTRQTIEDTFAELAGERVPLEEITFCPLCLHDL